MTVSPAVMVSGPYIADGSNKSWSFGFKVKSTSDLKVIVTSSNGLNPVEYLSNYAVDASSLNRDAGGLVTFPETGAPLTAGKRVWIASRVPYQQGTELSRQGAYSPVQVMGALDDLAIQIKQLALETGRAPKYMHGFSVPRILEEPEYGKTLVYDTDGNLINGLGTEEISIGIGEAQAAAASAQASANLALLYKNAVQLLADTIFAATDLEESFLPDIIRFSGTGAQTVFAHASLTGVDERATSVFINGVYQQKDTYSVGSGSITFSEAPLLGTDNIEVGISKSISVNIDISIPPDDVTYLEILPALPSVGNFEGRIVYLTADDLIYSYDGADWNSVGSGEGGGTELPEGYVAIQILDDLPASGNYEGRYVHLTEDGKLYGYAGGQFYTIGGGEVIGGGGGDGTGRTYIEIVDDYPLADNSEGRMIYLTVDGVIYVYIEGDWAAASGGLPGGGVLPDGTTFIEIFDELPSVGNFEGRVVYLTADGKLYTYTDGAWKTIIDGTDVNFPDGFTGIQIVGALPGSDNFAGRVVYLTTDGKLYRWTGSEWERSTAAADLTGQITETQITDGAISTPKLAAGSVTAAKITAGAVTADAILAGAVNAAKIAAGSITSTKLAAGAVTADAILAGAVTAAKIAVTQLSAISAVLGAVNIQSAILGSLQVGTINLAGNAVTVQAGAETSGGVSINATYSQIQSVTVSWGTVSPVYVFCQFKASNADELEIDIRSGGISLVGGGKSMKPIADGFSHYLDMFASGVVSGQALTFWLRRTASGSTTINGRKLIALVAKR